MLKSLFRKKAISQALRNSSTGLVPLSNLKSAAVYLIEGTEDLLQCIAAVRSFFREQGMPVNVYVLSLGSSVISQGSQDAVFLNKTDLNWYGKIKNRALAAKIAGDEELVVSLARDCFPVDFCAAATKARFRIGWRQMSGGLYDVVLSNANGESISQLDAFKAIADFLTKIK